MKKLNKNIILFFSAILMATSIVSCDMLEDEFYNPDKQAEPHFGLFFSNTIRQGHLFRMDYGAAYHYLNNFPRLLGIGVHPAFVDPSYNTSEKNTWTGWSGEPFNWDIFNKTSVEYNKDIQAMKLLYMDMSPEDQKISDIYMYCCDIISGYAFQRSVDLYDDIPYTEVGGAFQEKFYAKYDKQEFIYMDILDKLEKAIKNIDAYEFVTSFEKGKFASYDLLNKGDLDQWVRMANSLRLRMAMRLCHVQEEKAKSIIKDVLADGRLILEYEHNIGYEEQEKQRIMEITFFRALDELGTNQTASARMIEDMMYYEYQPGDEKGIASGRYDYDPRIRAIFQPDKEGRYIGLQSTIPEAEQHLLKYYTPQRVDSILGRNDVVSGGWGVERITAMYNRKTYMNMDMKFPVMHAPETNLFLIEAALRWPGEFGNIQIEECLTRAITASTKFYYNINRLNTYNNTSIPLLQHLKETASAPILDEVHLSNYCQFAYQKFQALDYKGKLQFLYNQKIVDMNIFNPYELFNEARRLIKDMDGNLPLVPLPNYQWMERFYYPSTEATNNKDNFEAVKAKNNHTTPVWWSGRTTPAVNTNKN